MHRLNAMAIILTALSAMTTAVAREAPLHGDALANDCKGLTMPVNSASERACAAYIQGFLDGSATAHQSEYRRPTATGEVEDDPAFSDRAARTRLGLDVAGAPGYCLPDDVSTGTVIEHVAATLSEAAADDTTTPREAVSAALEVRYPCPIE